MSKKALKSLLEERRALISPETHGLTRPIGPGQGRRAPGLTQQQVDVLLHRTIGTYHRLECGTMPNPSDDLLRDVALLFGFNEHEWVALYRYALVQDPPQPLHQSSGYLVAHAWQDAVDRFTTMAYINDASWNLLAHNVHFAQMFPDGDVPRNTMRWMLCDPGAREILTDWETSWAPRVAPQLRAALSARSDETLRQLEKDVLADPVVAPIYEATSVTVNPDGDERPLHHATLGPGWVTMCSAQPDGSPGARLMILLYRKGPLRCGPHPPLHA